METCLGSQLPRILMQLLAHNNKHVTQRKHRHTSCSTTEKHTPTKENQNLETHRVSLTNAHYVTVVCPSFSVLGHLAWEVLLSVIHHFVFDWICVDLEIWKTAKNGTWTFSYQKQASQWDDKTDKQWNIWHALCCGYQIFSNLFIVGKTKMKWNYLKYFFPDKLTQDSRTRWSDYLYRWWHPIFITRLQAFCNVHMIHVGDLNSNVHIHCSQDLVVAVVWKNISKKNKKI